MASELIPIEYAVWLEAVKTRIQSARSRAALAVNAELIQPMLDRIHANLHQSRTLATLRDTLLPKLLSGELRVRHAADQVERAT